MKTYAFARLLIGLFFTIAVLAAMGAAYAFFGLPGAMQMRVVTSATLAGVAVSLAATAQILEALIDTAANTARTADHTERLAHLTAQALDLAEKQARLAATRAG